MQLENYILKNKKVFNIEDYIHSLRKNINNKERELLNNNLNEQKESSNNDDLEVHEEKLKYGEVLEDELLDSITKINCKNVKNIKIYMQNISSNLVLIINTIIKRWSIIYE